MVEEVWWSMLWWRMSSRVMSFGPPGGHWWGVKVTKMHQMVKTSGIPNVSQVGFQFRSPMQGAVFWWLQWGPPSPSSAPCCGMVHSGSQWGMQNVICLKTATRVGVYTRGVLCWPVVRRLCFGRGRSGAAQGGLSLLRTYGTQGRWVLKCERG